MSHSRRGFFGLALGGFAVALGLKAKPEPLFRWYPVTLGEPTSEPVSFETVRFLPAAPFTPEEEMASLRRDLALLIKDCA